MTRPPGFGSGGGGPFRASSSSLSTSALEGGKDDKLEAFVKSKVSTGDAACPKSSEEGPMCEEANAVEVAGLRSEVSGELVRYPERQIREVPTRRVAAEGFDEGSSVSV